MSKRFHELVTTPHAWRIAFSRFFPGAEALNALDSGTELSEESFISHAERRLFTRLTALASWRSEYILRTRLLRALARGKPAETSDKGHTNSARPFNAGSAQITYNSTLVSTVTHLHANFGSSLNKKPPKFIHGAGDLGVASTSDPRSGKVDAWGTTDTFAFRQFDDTFPGDAQYGLGPGEVVGVPNVMDVSRLHGMVYGEGLAGGVLWYRSVEEKRGRALTSTANARSPEQGVVSIPRSSAVCAIWIAKNPAIPQVTDGLVGILSGASTGIVTAYSLGTSNAHENRLERGEITARWALSPGVPIIAIAVDENFSSKRQFQHRIWAVVLNALGEVFYLNELPQQTDLSDTRPSIRGTEQIEKHLETKAWVSGRSVHWTLIEPTRRIAKPSPYDAADVDGSYSPRSSWKKTYLSPKQLEAETKEIETFLQKKPKDFQKACEGWDMRRRLEVDFASTDDYGGGEAVFVIACGLDEGQTASIRKYAHCKFLEDTGKTTQNRSLLSDTSGNQKSSLFGGEPSSTGMEPTWSFERNRRSSIDQLNASAQRGMIHEWRVSSLLFGGVKGPEITSSAIDMSTYATLTSYEDPLLSINQSSSSSSPTSSPLASMPLPTSSRDIPGQRGRLLAVGTKTGMVMVWNMRAPTAVNEALENYVKPVHVIHTDSPQISCLALTALYLVHGGNDGLVQAWDLLASSTDPIRTLNSRFSSRARRRLVQAEASPMGIGINLFAAGAICLDPDPTILRGMVSLGSHLRYWSYSSLAADQYKVNKRRLRRSERGSNQGGDRFTNTGRGALKEYIANEKVELEREKRDKRKEEERLAGRFGVDLLGPGASEDEILAYATMLSEEAAQSDEARRKSASESSDSDETILDEAVPSPVFSALQPEDVANDDVAEAIRRSLEEHPTTMADLGTSNVTFKYAKKKRSPGSSPTMIPGASSRAAINASRSSLTAEQDDLDFALQLSLAEAASQADEEGALEEAGKGKGRAL